MKLLMIRHAQTAGNLLRRYIGATGEPLCPEGVRAARAAAPAWRPEAVFITPLLRTRQTAAIMFPDVPQVVVPALREMNFGRFEGRSAAEMEQDTAYRAWVDGGCTGACPDGESREEFCARVCAGFAQTLRQLAASNAQRAVFVVHGGTIMAVLSRFARPEMEYYDGAVGNCRCVQCEAEFSDGALTLTRVQKLDAPAEWKGAK